MDTADEVFMRRTLELAAAPPSTVPNPRVGAVLVRGGTVLAQACHEGPGTPHAEERVLDDVDARGATLYVTLEPCTHHGRTPPCAPTVHAAGVARVVVGTIDPDPRVNGSGIAYLRARGVAVETGVLAAETAALNAPYLHHRRTVTAYVTLKLAATIDGYLAGADRVARWITGGETRRRVHGRRLAAGAVMVGAGTVAADDPRLTVRAHRTSRQPTRIVVDSSGRTPPDAAVFAPDGEVIVATTADAPHEAQTGWKETGAEVVVLPRGPRGVDLAALTAELGRRGIVEVYCEGGARLASSLLRNGLVDRLELHVGPVVVGSGPRIEDLGIGSLGDATRWHLHSAETVDGDVVATYTRTA